MVRNYRKKTDRQPTSPSKLMEAVKLVNSGWAMRSAASHCNVKKSNLWDILKKLKKSGVDTSSAPKKTFKNTIGAKSIFTEEQEQSIVDYCIQIAKMGYGLTVEKVRGLAYEVAMANNTECPANWHRDKLAGIDWFHGFKKRHSDQLSIRTPEACSTARAMAFNKPNVENFFEKLEEVLNRHDSFRDGSRLYNLDETSTSTVQNTRKLVSPKGCKQVHQVKTAERGVSVTTSVIIGAHGTVLPPCMIFLRKVFKSNMIINAFPGTLGLANEKGYNTKDSFIDIMRHFIKCTNCSKENPCLLLVDNVGTHFSTAVLDLARDNGVVIFTFPPHCTHKLQPLDVGFFGPFKSYYDNAIHSFILSNPGVSVTIYHVAGFVCQALSKAAVPSTIIKSFEKTGIFPYNRHVFQDCDFIMSTVTEQPIPKDAPQSKQHQQASPSPNQENVAPDQNNFVIPKTIRGFPHAKLQNPTRKPRRKGKCMVATDTPEKNTISEREKEVRDKKEKAEERKRKREEAKAKNGNDSKKGKKRMRKSTSRALYFGSSDEESREHDEEEYDIDGDVSEIENIAAQSISDIVRSPLEGDYVLVCFKSGKDEKYYAGKIIHEKDEDDDLQISYLRRARVSNTPHFVMPNIPDLKSVHIKDIKAILPKPTYPTNMTKRQKSIIAFNFDFGTLHLC